MLGNGEMQGLLQQKQDFFDAVRRRDRTALESMFHDGYIFLGPDGQVLDKDQSLDGLTHQGTCLAADCERSERTTSVSLDGNTVTEVADVRLKGDVKGHDCEENFINTCTFINSNGRWQLISSTWQYGQSCPGCCGSMTVRRKCAVCGREAAGLPVDHVLADS